MGISAFDIDSDYVKKNYTYDEFDNLLTTLNTLLIVFYIGKKYDSIVPDVVNKLISEMFKIIDKG